MACVASDCGADATALAKESMLPLTPIMAHRSAQG